MTVVGAILRYSHIEPSFENNSRGQPPSTRPTSSPSPEAHTLFVILPNHHIWGPHTIQRAVFSTSSRSRASTTVVIEHYCPEGCCGRPSYLDGVPVPLLRRVQEIPRSEGSRRRSWQHLTARSSRILSRPLSRLIQRGPQDEPNTKLAPTLWADQSPNANTRRETQSSTY